MRRVETSVRLELQPCIDILLKEVTAPFRQTSDDAGYGCLQTQEHKVNRNSVPDLHLLTVR